MEEDRINNLTDDILLLILSKLAVKDALRSCIVFRNWRYLTSNLSNLDFDGEEIMQAYAHACNPFKEEDLDRFVNWVNQVVGLHNAPSINHFRVCFALGKPYTDHIDAWVKFAISKGVKHLTLDLPHIGYGSTPHRYTLWNQVVEVGSLDTGISFLTSLYLRNVDVCGKSLELLLSRCHMLERLFVVESQGLVNLKVTNNSRLKYLELSYCSLEQLELHAQNLVSFEFRFNGEFSHNSDRPKVVYTSVPSLVEASFGGIYCNKLLSNFSQIKHFSAHLTRLRLDLFMEMIDEDPTIPCFDNVKQLELGVYFDSDFGRSPLVLTHFMEACPLLQECKLLLNRLEDEKDYARAYPWCCVDNLVEGKCWSEKEIDSDSDSDSDLDSDSDSEEYSIEDVKHWLESNSMDGCSSGTLPCLRKLEWIGAFSSYTDQEFSLALYIVKNAPLLEKFICDSLIPIAAAESRPFAFKDDVVHEFEPLEDWEKVTMEIYKKRARKLALVIPSRVDVMII